MGIYSVQGKDKRNRAGRVLTCFLLFFICKKPFLCRDFVKSRFEDNFPIFIYCMKFLRLLLNGDSYFLPVLQFFKSYPEFCPFSSLMELNTSFDPVHKADYKLQTRNPVSGKIISARKLKISKKGNINIVIHQ